MESEHRQTAPVGGGSEAKRSLRARMRAQRAAMPEDEVLRLSGKIQTHLLSFPPLAQAASLYAFWPLAKEVDLRPLLVDLRDRGVAVGLPRSLQNGILEFRRFAGPENLVAGPFGVLQPPPDAPPAPPPDVILVPALAANRRGYRLGYGAGFYDRFLSGSSALTLCPIFSAGVIEDIPVEPHDLPVDWIITELGATPRQRS